MIHIRDLQVGDEVVCYMRNGYALQTVRNPDGSVIRTVPQKPRVTGTGDLTRCAGLVVNNDAVKGVLTLECQAMNHAYRSTDAEGTARARIPYTAFKRVQRLSKHAISVRLGYDTRPTRTNRYTMWRPYHTREDVRLR